MLKSDLFMNLFFLFINPCRGRRDPAWRTTSCAYKHGVNIFSDVLYGIVLGVIKLFLFPVEL